MERKIKKRPEILSKKERPEMPRRRLRVHLSKHFNQVQVTSIYNRRRNCFHISVDKNINEKN